MSSGICLSNSEHLWERDTFSPVEEVERRTPSRALKVRVVFFCVTSMDLITTIVRPALLVNLSLMLALTEDWLMERGS